MPNYNNKNIVLHELIGLRVEVIKSQDRSRKGIRGSVVDETKNTLVVETSSGKKIVPKLASTFKFVYGKGKFTVEGREINFRPYERLEKSFKFYKKRRA
ncbi:MAG TPA: ribonuclease P protein component 1 [Candidatus Acidoferrum sp.]|nr:ribonuclease P protein component 1 [Candidatus Acidoferrum sp.]